MRDTGMCDAHLYPVPPSISHSLQTFHSKTNAKNTTGSPKFHLRRSRLFVVSLTFVKAKIQKRLVNHKNSHGNNKKEQTECEAHRTLTGVISSPIGCRQRKQYFTDIKLRNTPCQDLLVSYSLRESKNREHFDLTLTF